MAAILGSSWFFLMNVFGDSIWPAANQRYMLCLETTPNLLLMCHACYVVNVSVILKYVELII